MKRLENAICVLGCLVLFISLASRIYLNVTVDYPFEYREMVTIKLASDISNGINPYTYSDGFPNVKSIYGCVTPTILAPAIKLLGTQNMVQVSHFSMLGILLIGIIVSFLWLRQSISNTSILLYSLVLLLCCFGRNGAFTAAFSDTPGLVLSIALAYLINRDTKQAKFKPWLYAFICVVEFYVKAYFVLVSLGVLIYLFTKSKKASMKFAAYGIIIGLLSILIIHKCLPTYLAQSLYLGIGYSDGLTSNFSGYRYSLVQFKDLLLLFILPCLTLLYMIVRKRIIVTYELIQLLVMLVPSIIFSKTVGQYLYYYFELIGIYLVYEGCRYLSDIVTELDKNSSYYVLYTVLILSMITTVYLGRGHIFCKPYSADELKGWRSIESYLIDDLDENKTLDLVLPPYLSFISIENGFYPYDCGQEEYYTESRYVDAEGVNNLIESEPIWPISIIWKEFMILVNERDTYLLQVKDNLMNSKYTVIGWTQDPYYRKSIDKLENNGYQVVKKEFLRVGNAYYNTVIYKGNK